MAKQIIDTNTNIGTDTNTNTGADTCAETGAEAVMVTKAIVAEFRYLRDYIGSVQGDYPWADHTEVVRVAERLGIDIDAEEVVATPLQGGFEALRLELCNIRDYIGSMQGDNVFADHTEVVRAGRRLGIDIDAG